MSIKYANILFLIHLSNFDLKFFILFIFLTHLALLVLSMYAQVCGYPQVQEQPTSGHTSNKEWVSLPLPAAISFH